MTLLPLVVAAIGGGLFAWVARGAGQAGSVIGMVGLLVVGGLAALLPDPPAGSLAGDAVTLHAYARLFLVGAAITGVLLSLLWFVLPIGRRESDMGSTIGAPRREPITAPSFLLFLGAATLALGIVSPAVALLPAAAGGIAAFVAVGRLSTAPRSRARRLDEAASDADGSALGRRLGVELLRIAISLAAAVIAIDLLAGVPGAIAGEPSGVGAASLAIALAVALRLGIVPIHGHIARLAETGHRAAVPVLCMWGPALFGLAALAGFEAAVIPLGLPLALEHRVIAGLALLTIAAGGVGALAQDDLDHVVAYSILQDAGFVLFAFAAADPAIWGAARAWLLILPLAKSALLGWAQATGRTFGTRSLPELRGWARRAPLLGLGLVVLTVATVGLPGLVSFDARLALLRGALSEPIRSLALVTSLTSLAVVVRLFVVGLDRPTVVVQGAPDERLRRTPPNLRRRVGATARETLDLNRAPLAAACVVMLSLLALGAGAGIFDLRGAASADVPTALPGPVAPTAPAPTFQPVPTPPAGSPSPTAT